MSTDFACPSCGNEWSMEPDDDGLFNGYGCPPCPVCGGEGAYADDYADYECPYCHYEWRVYGNGGLVFGCWPNCPKCGTSANEA